MLNPRIIGYIKGRPVYEIRGASEPVVEPAPSPPSPEVKTLTQEQVNALLADQKRKLGEKYTDYGDLKAKAARLDAIEEKNKTDLQKEQERATAAETRAVQAEAAALKAVVAAEKGVPLTLLAGTTREELEASAAALLEFRGDKPRETVTALTPGDTQQAERSVAAGAAMFQARRKPTNSTKE